jgi:hypothetical protein
MDEMDPAEIPLLFPDPVIELYLKEVNRAEIRTQLQKTPTERLQSLIDKAESQREFQQSRVREEATDPAKSGRENAQATAPKPFAGFTTYTPEPDPADTPLLFPDPVIQVYLKDIDRGLIREQLKKTPVQRLDDLIAMAGFYEEGRKTRARQ